jgi:hypothetical protein
VHRLDAARLFRLVLERAEPGTVVHAVGDEGDPMRSIAEVIGRVPGLPVQSVPAETFGILGNLFTLDQPSSSAWTREKFDWRPSHPSLLADLGPFKIRHQNFAPNPHSEGNVFDLEYKTREFDPGSYIVIWSRRRRASTSSVRAGGSPPTRSPGSSPRRSTFLVRASLRRRSVLGLQRLRIRDHELRNERRTWGPAIDRSRARCR